MNEPKYDALKLENQLCFPLYAASREVIKQYHPHLDELGLTYTQYIVMLVVWEERVISVKELGERLYLDSGTLSPVLKSLAAKGVLRRERSQQDERVVRVSVTEEGLSLRERAAGIPKKMDGSVPLTKEEAGELYRLLYKLLENLD